MATEATTTATITRQCGDDEWTLPELATEVRQRLDAIRQIADGLASLPDAEYLTRLRVAKALDPLQDLARDVERELDEGRSPAGQAFLLSFAMGSVFCYLKDGAADDAAERAGGRHVAPEGAPNWPHEACEWAQHYASELGASLN